jgi:hypothetical protein
LWYASRKDYISLSEEYFLLQLSRKNNSYSYSGFDTGTATKTVSGTLLSFIEVAERKGWLSDDMD